MKIKEFANIISGSTPKTGVSEYWDGELLWITPAEIKDDDIYISDTKRKITPEGVKSASLKEMKKNTILLTSRAPIGKVAIVGKPMYCNQGFKNLECNEKIVNPKYLYYWLSSRKEYLNDLGRGATFKEISKGIVGNIEVPIYSLESQDKIVQVLDRSKEIIKQRKEQIEILDKLIQSTFYSMFGDISKGDLCTLKDYINIIGGNAFSSKGYKDAGIPIIKIGTINKGYFDESNIDYWEYDVNLEKYKLLPEDLLITLTGTVGKDDYGNVLRLPQNYEFYYLNQRVAKLDITSELLDKTYLMYCLRQTNIKDMLIRNNRGIRQANISNNDIYNLQVKIPPIELQNQFAEIVDKIEKEKELLKQSLEQLETNFKALEQKAFNGELFN